ncbi:MAG: DNA polymerase III subunit beta [Candidatus Bathyarchaeota archaeon B24]|nr:MAG: DNA polymerase III subunit beta [Candidatus Bathyarchaeota archaeon B24]
MRGLGKVHSLSPSERSQIVERLRRVLKSKDEVVFAVVFGSFLTNPVFHDLDLGVYVKGSPDILDSAVYAEKLSVELTKRLSLPVDVVVLNHAPMWLRLRALKGKVVVDRDPMLRLALKLAAIDNNIAVFRERTHGLR